MAFRPSILALTCLAGGCGGVTLAPHLARERDLGPLAAGERHSEVLSKAAAFEKQNEKSRDVHWYRAWRVSAMIGLGQIEQARAVLDEILAGMTTAKSLPAQPDRLRMFVQDLRARVSISEQRFARALGELEQAFTIASNVEVESGGTCDRELMLASRLKQMEEVAALSGQSARAESAKKEMGERVDRWSRCVASLDFVGLAPVGAVAASLKAGPARTSEPAGDVPSPVSPPEAAPRGPSSAPPRDGPAVNAGTHDATTLEKAPSTPPGAGGRYALIDPSPYARGLEALAGLFRKKHKGVEVEVVIRSDGAHRALRIRLPRPMGSAEPAAAVFREAVVFFEETRSVSPRVEHVIVSAPDGALLANRKDVFDLFLERVDPSGFLARLDRLAAK